MVDTKLDKTFKTKLQSHGMNLNSNMIHDTGLLKYKYRLYFKYKYVCC